MIVLHVAYFPHVARVLSKWVSTELTFPRALIGLFAGVLLGDPDGVKVEDIVVEFGGPHDGFMAPGQTVAAVDTVPESPNDSVPYLHSQLPKYRDYDAVQRYHFALVDIIADLPAYRASRTQNPIAFLKNESLEGNIVIEVCLGFVLLADIVRWTGQDEIDRSIGHVGQLM